jgi:hypothetical protein
MEQLIDHVRYAKVSREHLRDEGRSTLTTSRCTGLCSASKGLEPAHSLLQLVQLLIDVVLSVQ